MIDSEDDDANGSIERVSAERIAEITETFDELFTQAAKGPQIEGLMPHEIEIVVKDPRTIWVKAGDESLPVFTPIENNAEYNETYFRGFVDAPSYYFASKLFPLLDRASLDEALEEIAQKDILLVSDYEEDDDESVRQFEEYLSATGRNYKRTNFADSRNESEAAVSHYASEASVKTEWAEGFIPAKTPHDAFERLKRANPEEYSSDDRVALVEPGEIDDEFMAEAWDMYSARFEELIKENPSMQAQTKEDLEKMMRSEGALTLAAFKDGKPVSIGYFVTDVQMAYWLRPEFYQDRFANETVWYFPGIFTKPGFEGGARAAKITDLGTSLAHECELVPIITFQCTNISKDYIPVIVKAAIEQSNLYTVDLKKIADYKYVGYSLDTAGSIE